VGSNRRRPRHRHDHRPVDPRTSRLSGPTHVVEACVRSGEDTAIWDRPPETRSCLPHGDRFGWAPGAALRLGEGDRVEGRQISVGSGEHVGHGPAHRVGVRSRSSCRGDGYLAHDRVAMVRRFQDQGPISGAMTLTAPRAAPPPLLAHQAGPGSRTSRATRRCRTGEHPAWAPAMESRGGWPERPRKHWGRRCRRREGSVSCSVCRGPEDSAPQGALMHPPTARSSRSGPAAFAHASRHSHSHVVKTPASIHSSLLRRIMATEHVESAPDGFDCQDDGRADMITFRQIGSRQTHCYLRSRPPHCLRDASTGGISRLQWRRALSATP
jgi:hypothetical protein